MLERSELRSLDSIFKVQACKLVHSVCLNIVPEQLALSVLFRGYYSMRFPKRMAFIRRNTRRVGLNSFTNRLHLLQDNLNYDWLDMSQNFSVKKSILVSHTTIAKANAPCLSTKSKYLNCRLLPLLQ